MVSETQKSKNKTINYRPDIDGLRAIAVLLVVFYHANINYFSGGFIGVDIFFVISGYLITKIILNNIENQDFSLKHFYERRIRRILPALYVVIFFSVCISYILFLPKEFESFGKSVVASSLSVSNILFWKETGYFDSGAELKPLLHTWSLGVEEQFYIFFPILIVLITKISKKLLLPLLFTAFLVSLILSIWATTNAMTANFYLAPTRAWELLTGSILAFLPSTLNLHKHIYNVLGLSGLIAIIIAATTYDYSTPFPGIYALLPCLGAALIIVSGVGGNTISQRILSLKFLVFIGLISYSLYLWHWPIFVFLNYIYANNLPSEITFAAISLSILCTIINWKYIEEPFRRKKVLPDRKKLFIIALASTVFLVAIGSFIIHKKGMPERFDDIQVLENLRKKNDNPECADIPARIYDENKCIFGIGHKKQIDYLIWGDSHAHAISPAIIKSAGNKSKLIGTLASTSGCPPLLGIELYHKSDSKICSSMNEAVFDNISSNTTVFLVARWGYYFRRSLINKEGPVWIRDEFSKERSAKENLNVLKRGIERTIRAIQNKGARVILVGSPPEFPQDIPARYWQFNEILSIPLSQHQAQTSPVSNIFDQAKDKYNISIIKLDNFFCEKDQCIAGKDSFLYFRDNDHISPNAAETLAPLFDPIFNAR